MNKPIGILGGSFDPIHNGHLHLAAQLLKLLPLKEIHLLPCYQNALKSNLPHANAEHRLAMIKLAIASQPHLKIDERELKRGGNSYTIETLKSFREDFPNTPLCLLMASDTFVNFTDWKDWQHIGDYAHLVVVQRPSFNAKLNHQLTEYLQSHQIKDPQQLTTQLNGCVLLQPIEPQKPISATAIRAAVLMENPAEEILPLAVWDYIQKHKLYRK